MPKRKTKRSAVKRFGLTASGKVKRKRAKLRHILTSKTQTQKRRLRKAGYVSKADAANIRRLISV